VPWWILEWSETKKGVMKPDLFGSFTSRDRAESYMEEANMSERAKTYQLGTVNSAKATQMLKARNVIEKGSVKEGMQRFRHPRRRLKY